MAKYIVIADVDQIVTKEVQLLIVAGSEEEAIVKARNALSEYPAPVNEPAVKRMVANKSRYWIPKSIDFKSVSEEKTVA